MRKLYLLLLITFFSCTENKLSINKETILKYNIVSEYGDIADTFFRKAVPLYVHENEAGKRAENSSVKNYCTVHSVPCTLF